MAHERERVDVSERRVSVGMGDYLQSRIQLVRGLRCFLDIDLANFWAIPVAVFTEIAAARFRFQEDERLRLTRAECLLVRGRDGLYHQARFAFTPDGMRPLLAELQSGTEPCLKSNSTNHILSECLRDILLSERHRTPVGENLREAAHRLKAIAEYADRNDGRFPPSTSPKYRDAIRTILGDQKANALRFTLGEIETASRRASNWRRAIEAEASDPDSLFRASKPELSSEQERQRLRKLATDDIARQRESFGKAKRNDARRFVDLYVSMFGDLREDRASVEAAFIEARKAWPASSKYRAPLVRLLDALGVNEKHSSIANIRSELRPRGGGTTS